MFFQNLSRFNQQIAAIEGNLSITYAQLAQAQQDTKSQIQHSIGDAGQLVFIKAYNGLSTLVVYLATLESQHCAVLLDPNIKEADLTRLVEQFRPAMIAHCEAAQQLRLELVDPLPTPNTLGNVGVLLSTSGSTGSAKHVALSKENLNANAQSICRYLPIKTTDVTLCALPFHYSYGLSVINSHLNQGACCVFSNASPVSREYWQLFDEHHIASFAGVPFSYELLLRLRFTQKKLPHLRYFTQAGGKLAAEHVVALANYAAKNDKQFFVMYGQTEATARMSYLAPDKVLDIPESIGQPIPDGEFKLVAQSGIQIDDADTQGELYYKGPNVMLGYVSCRQDITDLASLENKQPKWLATGDLGYRNRQGDYFINGRKSRFLKLAGQRLDLDDSERLLQKAGFNAKCTGNDNNLLVGVINGQRDVNLIQEIKAWLHQHLGLHPTKVQVLPLTTFPANANGKMDYAALSQLAEVSIDD
ncbi:AMP-binding protein [Aliiglaciecola litoralis]|uniref:AMP-binding protein n=1 Tax=Aliiglaciecola litoralis TaxID=582857 RepID=A0ABP3WWH9_9ALTE